MPRSLGHQWHGVKASARTGGAGKSLNPALFTPPHQRTSFSSRGILRSRAGPLIQARVWYTMSSMIADEQIFLAKAQEALAGAESELANRRYNNVANRCYYASFHAALAAVERAGLSSANPQGSWSHEAVQAAFAGQLIQRRKVYPSELRATLARNQILRNTADYERHWVTEVQARRAVRRTQTFVAAIQTGGERS